MWRPKENWKNPYKRIAYVGAGGKRRCFTDSELANVFEAGADAILEALKAEAEYLNNTGTVPYGYVLSRSLKLGEKGWLVFIPEEK